MFILNLNNGDESVSFQTWGHQPSQNVDFRLVVGEHEEQHSLSVPCDFKYLSMIVRKLKEQGQGLEFVITVHPLESKLLIGKGNSPMDALSDALNNQGRV